MLRVPSTPAATQAPQERWVDAQAIQALSGLLIRARTVADGVLAGLHRSQRHGRSIEFAEHKVYSPGDETKHIDWKAFGKFDRYYVKRFIEETAMRAFMVCDVSSSMTYAGGAPGSLPGVMKADYAKTLSATLAYLLLRQTDAVGCMTFAETSGPRVAIRGGDRHLVEVLEALEQAPVGGLTRPAESLASLVGQLSKRAMVVVCTDLLDSGKDILGPLSALRTRGADVAILHILHPDEVRFPFDSVVRFLDLEGDRTAQVDAPAIRSAYLEEVTTWLRAQEAAAHERGLDYHLITTDTPPARALLEFLAPRRRGE
ncbi:MAG: DUF58 domain-containing protein [Myxococcota bacterium]